MPIPLRVAAGSPSWPEEVQRIDGPPAELWLLGDVGLLSRQRRIAVVGTRSPTPYGAAQARRFAAGLAREGLVVVSGMARGIDQAAHGAALEVLGGTIAVLGSGVDRLWPASDLWEPLARRGLLLSEYSPGTPPRRHHFPLRNRLIAALTEAVLVVEAAWASGSLITARCAIDQGKQVFVVPGRVDHSQALGIVRLLREGAQAVASPENLLADLDGRPVMLGQDPSFLAHGEELDALERRIVAALRGETPSVEELASALGQSLESVLSKLIALELADYVARCPGGLWRLRNERQRL